MTEALSRPGEADDLERFVAARAVLRDVDLEAVELARDRAATDAELEASAREDVSGCCSGNSVTAVPMRIRFVRCAMTGTIINGFARSENAPPKCSSASHATSKPSASASAMSSNISV